MNSSTRESRQKRSAATRSSTKTTTKSTTTIDGHANVLGDHNRALHVTGNVYISVAPGEQLSEAERELLTSYRASSIREQATIHSVARMAASIKGGDSQ